jgi:hypothetical protein
MQYSTGSLAKYRYLMLKLNKKHCFVEENILCINKHKQKVVSTLFIELPFSFPLNKLSQNTPIQTEGKLL